MAEEDQVKKRKKKGRACWRFGCPPQRQLILPIAGPSHHWQDPSNIRSLFLGTHFPVQHWVLPPSLPQSCYRQRNLAPPPYACCIPSGNVPPSLSTPQLFHSTCEYQQPALPHCKEVFSFLGGYAFVKYYKALWVQEKRFNNFLQMLIHARRMISYAAWTCKLQQSYTKYIWVSGVL